MSVDTATTLRAVTDEDATVLYGLREHPISPFDDFSLPDPATEQDQLLPPPDQLSQMLVLDGDWQVVGTVQWHPVRYGPTRGSVAFNIGISLRPDARGRGHGSRAQALLSRYLFDQFPVHRVEAGTDIDNIAEQRALERAGFHRDGVTRGAQWRAGFHRDGVTRGAQWCAGIWHDLVIYSRLRTDDSPA